MSKRTGRALLAIVAGAGVLAALAAGAARASDDLRVEASVDRRELAQGEVLKLTVRVEGSDLPTALEPPPGPFDFEIVGRSQSQQTSVTFQDGGVQAVHVVTWELGLAPRRAGALTVPPFTVSFNAGQRQTPAIPVKVVAAGGRPRSAPQPRPGPAQPAQPAQPAPPGATWRGWERDVRVEVQVDRRNPWLGQQVTASVHLVSPVSVLRVDGFKPPSYDGFWSEQLELPKPIQAERRVVNGTPLLYFLVQRIALFPTRAGRVVVEPFQLDATVQVLSGNRLFDPFRSVEQVRRRSAPVELDVRPLPPGAPAGFESVNAGALALEVASSERSIPAGEPLAIRITARGEGNVRAWSLPRLPPIAGSRRYDPTSSEQLKPAGGRVAGSRTLETLLVAERPGELVIPPLEWPWFDVKLGRYQVARSAELRIPVTGEGVLPLSAPTAALAAGLRPIRSGEPLRKAGEPPWRRTLFGLLLLVPPGGFSWLLLSDRLRERSRRDAPERRRRGAVRAARRRLAAAERRLRAGDGAGFVAELERALLGYASDKLGRPVGGLTRDALAAALGAAGAHPPALRALLATLDGCDAARFGGTPPGAAQLDEAAEAMALLEEGDWSPAAEGLP
jgi:hypothetical protein